MKSLVSTSKPYAIRSPQQAERHQEDCLREVKRKWKPRRSPPLEGRGAAAHIYNSLSE